MHTLALDCDTYSNKENVAVVDPVTSAVFDITGCKAMFV